jgi:hypothetical protein
MILSPLVGESRSERADYALEVRGTRWALSAVSAGQVSYEECL